MNITRPIAWAAALATVLPAGADEYEAGIALRTWQLSGDIHHLPRLVENQTPNRDVVSPSIDFSADDFGGLPAPIYSTATGVIDVPPGPAITFRLTSDDGSRLWLDRQVVIDHDGRHGVTAAESAPLELAAGPHELLVEHFDSGGGRRLLLEWRRGPHASFVPVATTRLSTPRDLTRVTSPGIKQVDDGRRPGDGKPLTAVHPGWRVRTIRPEGFEPMVGALTFLPDGRLIVGTFFPMQRDDRSLPDIASKEPDKLYALTGVTGDAERPVTVEVVAEGLHEPSGLCTLDGELYVAQRTEVTRLRDTDGDGFFETHETVGNGWEGWNYHQFAFGLVPRDGLLYTALSTAMAPPRWEGMQYNAAPNGALRGSIIEIDPDSRDARAIAGGTRTPNGLGLGPDRALFYLDNQGNWMPTSQMAEVVPGRFFGHYNNTNRVPQLADRFPDGGHASVFADRPRAPATLLLPHNEIANSPTQAQPIPDGPFAGQMFTAELTAGGIRRVFLERVNGHWQGAVFRFTQGFEVGVNRMIWGPDGALYIGGIGGNGDWNWANTRFGLQRLGPTGDSAFELHSMRALPDGFEVAFTKPVDPAWLAQPENYRLQQWRYEPTGEYGGPKKDVGALPITAAEPSADGRRVRLEVAGLKAGYCVHLRTDPTSVDGEAIWSTEAWYTLTHIPATSPPRPARIAGRTIDPQQDGVGVGVLPPGDAAPLLSSSLTPMFRRRGAEGETPALLRSQDDLLGLPGFAEVGMGSGDQVSTSLFGDCRLHVEWWAPSGGEGQLAANSGVYLQNCYELQVLGTPAGTQRPAANEAGAIYNLKAADENASSGPGAWQAYDIWFRAARFRDGEKTENARITVYWNGRLVHDDVELPGPTGAGGPEGAEVVDGVQVGRLRLQDHESQAEGPVRYRNIWIAPLERAGPVAAGPWRRMFAEGTVAGWQPRGGAAVFELTREADGSFTLVGETRPDTPNTFLVSEAEYDDFELLFEVRLDDALNSGVQVRSEVIGGFDVRDGPVRGWQVELDPSARAFTGGIYEERGRGWLAPLNDAPYARHAYRPGDWNRVRVVARGPVIRTWVNGVPAATLFDALRAGGRIGWQVHGVGARVEPLQVRWRNVRLRAFNQR